MWKGTKIMPKGKGTYGGKVGRPSKKYPAGGMLNGASHEQGGIPIEAEGGEFIIQNEFVNDETLPILEQINETGEFPTSDAMFRSENYQLGGQVMPPTAPSITPNMPNYKKGGKV